jgi:nucleoside-diphosphate-sugar epimerase
MSAHHLVIGGGPVGRHVASILVERGDRVVIGTRTGRNTGVAGATYIPLDASDAASLVRAAEGAAGLFNTANPGDYPVWEKLWPPMAAALLEAAEKSGAVYAMTGNLYPIGPVDAPMTESMPNGAREHKGVLRARIWADALAAHQAGRVRAFEVRASDWIGGGLGHISRVLPTAMAGRPVRMIGRVDLPHSYTDVKDAARTLVAGFDDPGAHGSTWHVPSNPPKTQTEVIDELLDTAGRAHVSVTGTPPALLRVLGIVSPMAREVAQLSYQLTRPYVLDSTAAERRFGITPSSWREGLQRTVDELGGSRVGTP